MRLLSTIFVLAIVSALGLAAGCDKKADDAAPATTDKAAPAKAEEAAKAVKPATVQNDLKVTLGDKAVEGLHAFAQLDEGRGESYQITFMTAEATCDTLRRVLAKEHESITYFTVNVQRALKPDGELTWAYSGTAFGLGGSTPASMTPMTAFEVKDGTVSGTLPGDVGREDDEKGKLVVTGAFSAPICDPIKAMKLREWKSSKEAVPIPAKDSTARVTVAGKTFDVKGATAFPTPDKTAWDVRLTAKPHGCSFPVRDDLILTVRVGGDDVRISVGGHLMAGSTMFRDVDGLKVEHIQTEDGIALTLSGEQNYAPNDVDYKVSASGKVTAALCKIE